MDIKVFLFAPLLFIGGCALNPTDEYGSEGAAAKPDAFALVASADRAYKQGKWQEAEQGYRTVIEAVPTDAYAYFRLGNSLAKQFRFNDAADAYQKSLMRNAEETKVYHNLAIVHLLQAESSLSAGLKTISETDGNAEQVKHMLWELKKITRINLKEINSPVSGR